MRGAAKQAALEAAAGEIWGELFAMMERGMTASQALDARFGPGTTEALAAQVYYTIRERAGLPREHQETGQ